MHLLILKRKNHEKLVLGIFICSFGEFLQIELFIAMVHVASRTLDRSMAWHLLP